jgi:site-specific recombinase XerC
VTAVDVQEPVVEEVRAALTVSDVALMMEQALKDRSYRATPLGHEVARYYRWKKNEWGASATTLRDYEAILARLATHRGHLELHDFTPPEGTEHLRGCWDYFWGDASARTRAKVRSVWVDFFEWAIRERGLRGNPARALARPKTRDVRKETFGKEFVATVIDAQTYPADRLGCILILRYGLRQGGLRNLQMKHCDFERQLLTIHTKGGRIHELPVVDQSFWRDLLTLQLDAGLGPDSYLLYWQDSRRRRVPLDEAEETLETGKGEIGYRTLTSRKHDQEPSPRLAHVWWYRCLERAGVVAKGVQSGMNMHRGRHTSITEVLRETHNLKLAQMLAGHKDIRTTAEYAQFDTADLEAALRQVYGEE